MDISTQLEVDALPRLIYDGVKVAQTASQCDMLLLSLLTASGYAMPNYFVCHGQPAHRYAPSLMALVVAPPASGKGIMNLSRRLIQPIHDELREEGRREALVAEAMGLEPKERMAFLPANCSNNAFLKLLNDNDGRALMIETEMDVVSGIWRHDYGNYSTTFRQAFEHETISKARKVHGEEYLEVKDPCVSVLLSGTMGQLEPLLKSRENGLASRFVCYMAEDVIPFMEEAILKHDEPQTDDTEAVYTRLGKAIYAMYHWLKDQSTECEFRLTPEQSEMMRGYFHDGYLLTLGDMQMPTSFDPVVKRLAVSALRIGMILAMVRYFEEEVQPRLAKGETVAVPPTLVCSDTDFGTMMLCADVLLGHAIDVHELLPTEGAKFIEMQDSQSGKQMDEAMALLRELPQQFTTKEALTIGQAQNVGTMRTIQRCIQRLLDAKIIARIRQGVYVKI